MVVLWWLVPPLAATLLAMVWASWASRRRGEVTRDDSPAAMDRMRRAIERPAPRRGASPSDRVPEPTHGVAIRQRRPSAGAERPSAREPTPR
jgi:hypothetical protein